MKENYSTIINKLLTQDSVRTIFDYEKKLVNIMLHLMSIY